MTYAIVAGLCAAGAGFFGKLPSLAEEQQLVYPWLWVALSISVMIALNGIMWTFYTKALHERGGTLVATVVSSGANYCFSALLGSFVFGETTTVIWWLGMALVVLGLFTVNYDQSRMKKEE